MTERPVPTEPVAVKPRLYSDLTTKTKVRQLTRRGVMWLGQTCNIRCYFCYFLDRIADKEHEEHAFMSLDKAKYICDVLRYKYDNNAIDIQGGEPTIYKHIYELVAHCYDIGLMPTLITNAIMLADSKRCEKLRDAGLRDLLVSVHGIGKTYDEIVGVPGGSDKQMRALANFQELGIRFRFNVVLSKPVMDQLQEITALAVKVGARAVNFLAFNPFGDQSQGGKRSAKNVPSYSEVGANLNLAFDTLEAAGIEANARYVPICMVAPRHRKSIYNYQQLSYDQHEWDYASWAWTEKQAQRMSGGGTTPHAKLRYETYGKHPELMETYNYIDRDHALYRDYGRLHMQHMVNYKYTPKCKSCAVKNICDGFHWDYMDIFGSEEAQPIKDLPAIDDPTYFINEQEKIIEQEDWDWMFDGGQALKEAAE